VLDYLFFMNLMASFAICSALKPNLLSNSSGVPDSP